MKIREYLERIESWEDEDRERYLRPLLGVLCPVSLRSIFEHQQRHIMAERPDYEVFKTSQNREIIACLKLELSERGSVVREELGLPPLTLDTDVEIEGERDSDSLIRFP